MRSRPGDFTQTNIGEKQLTIFFILKTQTVNYPKPEPDIPQTYWLPEMCKLAIFVGAWFILPNILHISGIEPLLVLIFAIPLGYFSLICFNAWRARQELRDRASIDWLKRVARILMQYEPFTWQERLRDERWLNWLNEGLTPERAVGRYTASKLNEFLDKVAPDA